MANSPNKHNLAWVRTEMLDQRPPPASGRGVIGWARDNLFYSVFSSIMTVVSIAVIYWVLAGSIPWVINGIWSADNLQHCREQLAGANGACWAVISERSGQLLYGFYTGEGRDALWWRPTLTFVLLFVALIPVLFTNLPRQLLWLSAAYPFLAVWLLWGGSLWGPVLTMLGFGIPILFDRYGPKFGTEIPQIGWLIIGLFAAFIWWIFLVGPIAGAINAVIPVELMQMPSNRFGGFMLTFLIGISGIAFSFPLGIVLALARESDLRIVSRLAIGLIELVRGMPLIVWLFVAQLILGFFLPQSAQEAFDLTLRVIVIVSLFYGVYMAEVIRGGLASLPKGQYEAADSLGLTYDQATRLIILPQALKVSVPAIVNTFISLFKDTTLVALVGLLDPIGIIRAIQNTTDWQGVFWELFIFVGLVFFIACLAMSQYSIWLEKKLKTDHR